MIPILTKQVQLIGIHGKAGAGKDTIGCFIAEEFANCYGDPFAGPLKECAVQAFGIDREYFDDPVSKEEVWDTWGVSPRKIVQFLGTEVFRETISKLLPAIGTNFWVERLAKKINGEIDWVEYEDGDTVIITDVRFQNEVDFVLANNGIIFHVVRDGATGSVGIQGHASESLVLTEGPNIYKLTNNGTKEELYDQVVNDLKNSHLTLHHLLK